MHACTGARACAQEYLRHIHKMLVHLYDQQSRRIMACSLSPKQYLTIMGGLNATGAEGFTGGVLRVMCKSRVYIPWVHSLPPSGLPYAHVGAAARMRLRRNHIPARRQVTYPCINLNHMETALTDAIKLKTMITSRAMAHIVEFINALVDADIPMVIAGSMIIAWVCIYKCAHRGPVTTPQARDSAESASRVHRSAH